MREMTREEMLALTPDHYLASGFLDPSGAPRQDLLTDDAVAAATQLHAAEVSPQEFAYLLETLRQILPLHAGTPRRRIAGALDEAIETVGRMIRQPNNEGLVGWALACAMMVRRAEDIDALLRHMQAVLRQYAVLATLPPPEPSAGEP
jgi:hypothetical protein